jgi:WhiB family redox-sensing transcriptional regulator
MNLEWFKNADCKGKTNLFFGPYDEKVASRRVRERQAKRICDGCASIYQCRQYARENGELGVWGGEGEEERFDAGFSSDPFIRRRMKMREARIKRQDQDQR